MSYGRKFSKNGLVDLAECLSILAQYTSPSSPTHCEHDVLTICVDPALVSAEDLARLDALGVHAGKPGSDNDGCFYSFRFGGS